MSSLERHGDRPPPPHTNMVFKTVIARRSRSKPGAGGATDSSLCSEPVAQSQEILREQRDCFAPDRRSQ